MLEFEKKVIEYKEKINNSKNSEEIKKEILSHCGYKESMQE